MGKADVISIGAIDIDLISFQSKFPEAEEKINSIELVEYGAAGVAMDCVIQVARLGMKCGHIGKMGDDYYGEVAKRSFAKLDIDSTHCTEVPGEKTAVSWVMVNPETGERCHTIHAMKNGNYETAELLALKDYICGAKAVHMEMLQMPMEPLYHVSKMCRENGVITSMDMDIAPHYMYEYGYADPELFMKTCAETDLLKLCAAAVPDLTDEKDIMKAAKELYGKLGARVLTITLGEKGCVCAYKEENSDDVKVIEVPAFNEPGFVIRDTTGAGDAFQGGFIYGYLKGYSIPETAELATACAYLEAQDIGANSSADHAKIEEFLKERGWSGLR